MDELKKGMKYIQIALDEAKYTHIALNQDNYAAYHWPYFYKALINETIGYKDNMEQGLLKAASIIKTKHNNNDINNICSSLLRMKQNDKKNNKCYDCLVELLNLNNQFFT